MRLKQIPHRSCQELLEEELILLQKRFCMGYELRVKWLPGRIVHHNGRKLAEEVRGDTIIVYTKNPKKAVELLRHGFWEWLMNRYTRPYRQLINALVTLFEKLQYERKEDTIDALDRLLTNFC